MTDPDRDPDTVSGAVDEATPGVDSVLGREVAMVVLPPVAGDELAERTERVRRLAALHHPNLVEIYDVDGLVPDTESTLVLQHVAGRGLADLGGPWAPESLARVAAQVTAGLAHAHSHEVVHGAIGPASVVVDAGLQSWLTGFTATLRPELHVDTAAYLAPDDATREIDVAALGRTLREALVGGSPAPVGLTTVLDAMTDGSVTARDAAERLTRTAENLAAGEEDTGLIALPTRYWRAPAGGAVDGPTDVVTPTAPPRPAETPHPVETPSVPAPVPTPAPAVGPSSAPVSPDHPPPAFTGPEFTGPEFTGPERASVPLSVALADGRAPRRARRRAHVRRAALLGGAAVTAALASAVALWATEGASGPEPGRSSPPLAGPVATIPAGNSARPAGGAGDQAVDSTARAASSDPASAARVLPPPVSSVLPPAPPPAPPVLPPPPTPTSRPTGPPSTTEPRTTPPSTTVRPPTSTRTSPSPTTRTSRPTTPRSGPVSSPTRSSSSGSRSPAALAAGR